MSQKLLLTPGPTEVPATALEAQALPMIHHRTAEFQEILQKAHSGLQQVFKTKNPVLILASSGTGAMEASIVNMFSKGDKVIAAHAGKFGERYAEIAKAYGLDVVELKEAFGHSFCADDIAVALKEHPDAKGVLTTLLETCTAVVHHIKDIAAITQKSNALLLVDAISGLSCDPLEMDAWGIDVVVSGSQKGFMLPPGLGFISMNQRARDRMATSDLPKYYFNLAAALKAYAKNDTPYTPAVSLIRGLNATLELMLKDGIEAGWQRHSEVADWVRSKVESMGLKVFGDNLSNAVTTISMPEGISSGDLIKSMRDEGGVIMANGQAELKGRVVRFAHMGMTASLECAQRGFDAFEKALIKAGFTYTK
ncbi:MAG: aspartate aminotransferase-like enzyme [Candidatus Omnitrophota bacterium]|jgi:aspartate aminotransferase-like enzyme